MRLEGPHQQGVQELMQIGEKMAVPAFSALFFSLKFPTRNVALSDGKLHPRSTLLSCLKGTKNQD